MLRSSSTLASSSAWILLAAPLALSASLGAGACTTSGAGAAGNPAATSATTGTGAGGGAGSSGAGATGATPRDFFNMVVYPALTSPPDGCNGCHNLGGSADLPFLGNPKGEPSPYEAITTWPAVVVKDPATSILVVHASQPSHGNGQAPIMSEGLKQKCLQWLAMEAKNLPDAMSASMVHSVKPFKPILGGALNTVYLDDIDPSLKYAAISFNALELSADLIQLKNLEIHPVEGQSIHVVHPLFTVYPQTGGPSPDPVDSFSGVDETFTLDTIDVSLGTGELVLSNWQKDAYLGIAFESITNNGSSGSPGVGCKDVADFQKSVVPQMQYCADNCHGGKNPQANATMDLSKLDSMPPDQACAQVRARITPGDPVNSKILIVTDPTQQAVHMYKFKGSTINYKAFKDAVSPWIISEAQ